MECLNKKMAIVVSIGMLIMYTILAIGCAPSAKFVPGEIVEVKLTGDRVMVMKVKHYGYLCRTINKNNSREKIIFKEFELVKIDTVLTPGPTGRPYHESN